MIRGYDAVVIGAGNGGLSAAAFLSNNGKRVLVLEKENRPGGCAVSIRRGRFEFEASLHELCQMGTGKYRGAARKLLESYGLSVDWVEIGEAFRSIVKGENGFDVTMPADVEGFIEEMEKAVPDSSGIMRQILEIGRMLSDGVEWLAAHGNEPRGLSKLEMLLKYGDLMKLVPVSTEEAMKRFGVPERAKEIFESYWDYVSADSEGMSFAVYCFMVYTYLTQKPWTARMRSNEISLAFDRAIRDAGSDIWYNAEVSSIDAKNGKVKGVSLSDGEYIETDHVIADLMPDTVFGKLIDPNEVPERERKLISARRRAQTPFTVYLGLDIPKEELGFSGYDTFVRNSGDTHRQYLDSGDIETHGDYCVTVLNEAVEDASPEGTCIVQFSKFYADGAFSGLTAENYRETRDRIANETVSDFEKLCGRKIRDHIEEIVISTPVTWARYLGTPGGDVYGYVPEGWDGMFPRTESGHRLDHTIEGLRLCGGAGTQMDGYSQAFLSGSEQARYTLEEMK